MKKLNWTKNSLGHPGSHSETYFQETAPKTEITEGK